MIPGDLLSAFPHRQFHTLPGLLDSWAALPNSNPNACVPLQEGSLHHFYDGLWYDPTERRTHDLPCERRTRYRLSQPDTVRGRNDLLLCCYTYVRGKLPATDACGLLPVLRLIKVPVPKVTFTSPVLKQHCPNMALC